MKFFNLFRLHQTDNIKTKNINKKRADTKKISKRDLTTLQVLFHIILSEIVESLLKVQFANSKIFLQTLKTKKSDSLYLQRKTISHPILLNLLSHMQGKA